MTNKEKINKEISDFSEQELAIVYRFCRFINATKTMTIARTVSQVMNCQAVLQENANE